MTEPTLPTEPATRSDGELLRQYLDSRDAVALTALVTRHAALVRGVCRRVLGDTPDADDAFQATFLVLIRRGGRTLKPVSLAAWLYGVAHRIAWRQRRQQRPATPIHEGHAMTTGDSLDELATRHDAELFDAELARLPEKYRAPIVLHHLEGKTHQEVAAELRLTAAAVDGLLKRGRNELRVRLARRGVVFGVTLAAVQTTQQAIAAIPADALIRETVQNALACDQVLHSDVPRTPADHLARQELFTMNALQFTKAAGWGVAATLLIGVAGAGLSQHEMLNLSVEDEPTSRIAVSLERTNLPNELTLVSVAEAEEEDEPAQPAAKPDSINAEADVEKLLETRIDFKAKDIPLKEALQQLAKQLNIPWEPLAEQLIDPEWRVNFDLTQATVRHILMVMLEPVALEHHFEEGRLGLAVTGWTQNQRALDIIEENLKQMIGGFAQNQQLDPVTRAWQVERFQQTLRWIERHRDTIVEATEAELPEIAEAPAAPSAIPDGFRTSRLTNHLIAKQLDSETELAFTDTSLRKALAFVGQMHGFNVYLDDTRIAADGASLEHQINLEVSGVKLRSALKLILESTGLDYVIEDEVLRITSKQAAENHHEMRLYPDVAWSGLATAEGSEKLVAFVKDAVGDRWKTPGSDGPGGTIQWTPHGLAVRHNQRTIAAVEKTLALLQSETQKAAAVDADVPAKPEEPREITGVITDVDQNQKLVKLSIGRDDGLRPGWRARVIGVKDGVQVVKGTVEIFRVVEDTATATIIEQNAEHPITVNDEFDSLEPKDSRGMIRAVNREQGRVWINLGSQDHVRPRMSFPIYDDRPEKKGQVEIIKILSAHLCEAKITEEDLYRPLAMGDRISPERLKNLGKERVSIVGEIDLDGDGKSDRELFHQILAANGVEIESEIDEHGMRTGKALTPATSYIVLGKLPALRVENKLRNEARQHGVRVIKLDDLLADLGTKKRKRLFNPANPIHHASPPPRHYRQLSPPETKIETALRAPTEIAFTDTSLRDASDYLEQMHNVQIVFDERRLKERNIENPRINLEVTGVELASALNLMLEPLELDYIVKNEVVHITTDSAAETHHELRIYDLAPLKSLVDDLDFSDEKKVDRVLRIIQDAVVSRWDDDETDYFGHLVNLTPRGLIVRHNQRTHREIENFLEQLQRAEEK